MRNVLIGGFFLKASFALAASEVVHSFDLGGPYFHASSQAIEAYPHWGHSVIGPIPTVIGATSEVRH